MKFQIKESYIRRRSETVVDEKTDESTTKEVLFVGFSIVGTKRFYRLKFDWPVTKEAVLAAIKNKCDEILPQIQEDTDAKDILKLVGTFNTGDIEA